MKRIVASKEYRTIMLNTMIYIADLAHKHHINCFMAGGTLLGAVRHQGFIPWDDDIDMMLLRDDYEKLIYLINNDNSVYRALTVKNDFDYYYPFTKVVDTRTILSERDHLAIKNNGVGVDLFPIDVLPNSKKRIINHFKNQRLFRKWFENLSQVNRTMQNNVIIALSRRTCLKALAVIIDINAKKYHPVNIKWNASSTWGYYEKEILPTGTVGRGKQMLFEGHQFMAPAGYDRYLTQLYGDYMTPPPKAKQHNEHMASAWWK